MRENLYSNSVEHQRPSYTQKSGHPVGARKGQDPRARLMVPGIDAARRTAGLPAPNAPGMHILDRRPQSVLCGSPGKGGQNPRSSRRKKSAERTFVPLTTVQIRAYEFQNLRVSGEAPTAGKPEQVYNRDINDMSPRANIVGTLASTIMNSANYQNTSQSNHQASRDSYAATQQRIRESWSKPPSSSLHDYSLQLQRPSQYISAGGDPMHLNVTHDTLYLDKSITRQDPPSLEDSVVTATKVRVSALSSHSASQELTGLDQHAQ